MKHSPRLQEADLVEGSAPFACANLMMLEELGICSEGEGGAFVESRAVEDEGNLPFNTLGGYLSSGQSGQGIYLPKEVMAQLWARAEGRQVPNARLGLVHGHGGPLACHSVMLLSKEPTS